jgi:hypothetical protein
MCQLFSFSSQTSSCMLLLKQVLLCSCFQLFTESCLLQMSGGSLKEHILNQYLVQVGFSFVGGGLNSSLNASGIRKIHF